MLSKSLILIIALISFISVAFQARFEQSNSIPKIIQNVGNDTCSGHLTCQECVSEPYCGWCSDNVTYTNGTRGPQCAGFDPNHPDEHPFTCTGRYQTTECEIGYLCNKTDWKCEKTTPGNGEKLQECEQHCIKPAPVYACNHTTLTCHEVPPGHGKSLPLCQAECISTYKCNATSLKCEPAHSGDPKEVCDSSCGKPSNNTPADLIGMWRGLQINNMYIEGEWQALFTKDNVTIWEPKSTGVKLVGDVATLDNPSQVWITITQGPGELVGSVLRGIFQETFSPVIDIMTLAFGAPNELAPSSFDAGMISKSNETVYVMGKCIQDPPNCYFYPHSSGPIPKVINARRSLSAINDSCMPYKTCEECITNGTYCGWCSENVKYNDGTNGSHCAGFNPDDTKKPFVCDGIYTTKDCGLMPTAAPPPVGPVPPVPPVPVAPTYSCNTSSMCYQVPPGHGESLEQCELHCGHPPGNHTPVALIGKWRGLEIQVGYTPDEWHADFNATAVTIMQPDGVTWHATVGGDSSRVWLMPVDGPFAGNTIKCLWQIQYGVETKNLAFAWGKPGGAEPTSFESAMHTEGQREFYMASCLKEPICKWEF